MHTSGRNEGSESPLSLRPKNRKKLRPTKRTAAVPSQKRVSAAAAATANEILPRISDCWALTSSYPPPLALSYLVYPRNVGIYYPVRSRATLVTNCLDFSGYTEKIKTTWDFYLNLFFTFESCMRNLWIYVKSGFLNFHKMSTFWDPLSDKKRFLEKCLAVERKRKSLKFVTSGWRSQKKKFYCYPESSVKLTHKIFKPRRVIFRVHWKTFR